MKLFDLIKPHRTWEDGVGLLLGLIIALTPWLFGEPPVLAVVLNSTLVGLAVLLLAQLEMLNQRRWEEVAELACGAWLVTSPFVFDYSHQDHLRVWHWVLGAMVSTLAVFELWQNKGTSE